jgi:hypothetical protein
MASTAITLPMMRERRERLVGVVETLSGDTVESMLILVLLRPDVQNHKL